MPRPRRNTLDCNTPTVRLPHSGASGIWCSPWPAPPRRGRGRAFHFRPPLRELQMSAAHILVIACRVLALAYGVYTSRVVLAANAGNGRMPEMSGAVQVGASAYLNRQ